MGDWASREIWGEIMKEVLEGLVFVFLEDSHVGTSTMNKFQHELFQDTLLTINSTIFSEITVHFSQLVN